MNDDPTTGSPPIPTIVDWPIPSCVSSLPIWYVSVPERLTSPTGPGEKISAGMIPTFAFPGERTPGQFGPDERDPARADVVVDPEHVVRGDPLRDADHRLDARVDRLVDRVRREPGRHEDHRGVRLRLRDRVAHRVEDRDPVDRLAALPGRDARDDVRPVGAVAQRVERPLAPGDPLDDEARRAVDDDRHR